MSTEKINRVIMTCETVAGRPARAHTRAAAILVSARSGFTTFIAKRLLVSVCYLGQHQAETSRAVHEQPFRHYRHATNQLMDGHSPYSGFESPSLRQLHLAKQSLPARQRAKNFNKHRY